MFLANSDRTAASARMTQIEEENRALRARLKKSRGRRSSARAWTASQRPLREAADGDRRPGG